MDRIEDVKEVKLESNLKSIQERNQRQQEALSKDNHRIPAGVLVAWNDIHYLLSEIDRLKDIEKKYRRLLWSGHGHSSLYGDDGEMQCMQCFSKFGVYDYLRAPLEDIEKAFLSAKISAFQEDNHLKAENKKLQSQLDELRKACKPIVKEIVKNSNAKMVVMRPVSNHSLISFQELHFYAGDLRLLAQLTKERENSEQNKETL